MERELIDEFEEYKNQYGVSELVSRFEEKVIDLDNDELSLYFSKLDGCDLNRHGEIILNHENLDTICDFACSHSYDDAKKHVKYIWDSKDTSSNLKYASSVFNSCCGRVSNGDTVTYSDVLKLRRSFEAVLDSSNVNGCSAFLDWFYRHSKIQRAGSKNHSAMVDYGNRILGSFQDLVMKAESQIIQEGDAKDNYHCVEVMSKLPEWAYSKIHYDKHSKAIIDSRDLYYNYFYAKDYGANPGVDVLEHGSVILEDGNSQYNYLFARNVEGADKKSHSLFVANDGDLTYNYLFAKDVKGIDILPHEEVILNSLDASYNYLFARDVEGADILAHGDIVIRVGTPKENFMFARDIPGCDFEKHEKVASEVPYYEFLLSMSVPREEKNLEREKKRDRILKIEEKIKQLKRV